MRAARAAYQRLVGYGAASGQLVDVRQRDRAVCGYEQPCGAVSGR